MDWQHATNYTSNSSQALYGTCCLWHMQAKFLSMTSWLVQGCDETVICIEQVRRGIWIINSRLLQTVRFCTSASETQWGFAEQYTKIGCPSSRGQATWHDVLVCSARIPHEQWTCLGAQRQGFIFLIKFALLHCQHKVRHNIDLPCLASHQQTAWPGSMLHTYCWHSRNPGTTSLAQKTANGNKQPF